MNVLQSNIDNVNALLKVQVSKADYSEKVEKSLKDFRKKANMPGFRPGTVPVSLVKKMYGKSMLAEEINKLVSEALYNFIQENNLSILGEPLPAEDSTFPDFDNDEDFEFSFDIALAPELELSLSAKNKVTYYDITVSQDMIDKQVSAYKSRFGKYTAADKVEEKDVIKGELIELTANGSPKEGGVRVDSAVLSPAYMKDKKEQAKVLGLAKDAQFTFNPSKAFDNNEAEIASLLQINKDNVKNCTSDFSFTIKEITRYAEGELNQELFDAAMGKDKVKTEEEFVAKIKEALQQQLIADSDVKFSIDMKDLIVSQLADVKFPDVFLKKWLKISNPKLDEEAIEKDFPKMLEDLRWQLAKDKIGKENDLKLEQADIEAVAKKSALAQFAQYGMLNVPDEILEGYVKDMLKNKDAAKSVAERAIDDKIFEILKTKVSLVNTEISMEDFNKMFEK